MHNSPYQATPRRVVFRIILGVALLGVTGSLFSADALFLSSALESIKVEDLRKHVNVLASDTLEGREAGSRGGKAAGVYLIEQLKRFGVQPAGSEKSFYQFFGSDYRNVIGLLPGSDSELKNEYVIVCAHYDHVGYGSRTNSYGPYGYIHNGADDNASGTSGLLELVEAMSAVRPRPKRSVLFIFWDAEEKGLLGSEHWVESPTVPLKSIRMTFNLDMIGRLRSRSVQVFGIRTAAGLRRFLAEQNDGIGLQFDFDWTIKRDSDHYPFIQYRIPSVMLHTGKHDDYHRPSDDVDKLNYDGMQQLTRLMFRAVYTAADSSRVASFRLASRRESEDTKRRWSQSSSSRPMRLGVAWSSELDEQGIVQISRVEQDSPAERAGLKVGDQVLKFADYEIDGQHEFGSVVLASSNETWVMVRRKGKEEPQLLSVRLQGDPQRLGVSWREDDAEPGCVILTQIVPGSPASVAGLKPGERIYAVDGEDFTTGEQFLKLVTADKTNLKLTIERHGRISHAELKLLPKLK